MGFHKFLLTVSLVLSVIISYAQVTTSSMKGSIQDEKGQPLIGATVKATHVPSGTVYGTVTQTNGNFTMQGMRIGGPYKIEISYLGYQPRVIEGVSLALGEAYVVKEKLSEGGTELQTINVVGQRASKINRDRTGASTIITSRQISSLPTISRSITDFTRLTPQANGNGFAGRDGRYNNLQVDGANLNNNFGLSTDPLPGGGMQPISLDAYDEIAVNIAPYDVRQAGFTGAGINAVTKSGTNTFHGTVYGFYRGENFTGGKVKDTKITVTPQTNKIIGGSFSGPIIKNKLFFFVNGEYEKGTYPGVTYHPTYGDPGEDGRGNLSSTSADSLKVLSDYLKSKYGYNTGVYDNFPSFSRDNHKVLVKLDYNINAKHKLTVKYSDFGGTDESLLNSTSVPNSAAGGFTVFTNTGVARSSTRLFNNRFSDKSMSYANSNYATKHISRTATAELNSNFSSRISNQLLLTYTHNQDTRQSPGGFFPTVDIFDGNGNNQISFGTDPFTQNNDVKNDVYTFTDNFTYSTGAHNITAGASYEYQKVGNMFMPGSGSYYIFNSLQDFLNDKSPAFYAYTYSLVPGEKQVYSAQLKVGQLGFYAQDEYNVSNHLKVTLGLRADMPVYPEKALDNPAISALQFPDKDGKLTNYSTADWPKAKILLSPRLGFRWDVMGDKSLIVRGGTGIFTGKIPFVFLTNMPTNSGMYQNSAVINQAADLASIKFNPNPDTYASKFPSTITPTAPKSFVLIDKNFKFPQVWRTNIGIDKGFENGITVSVDAIYTKDINAVRMRNANLKNPTQQLNGPDNRNYYGTTPAADKYVYPNLSSVIVLENTNKGNSLALTAQVSKSFSNGLYGSIAYTYTRAKEVTANPGSQASSVWQVNQNVGTSNAIELGNSQYALPHRVIANVSYRIEYLKHFATTLSLFYEGMNLSNYSYVLNGDLNGDGNSSDLMYVYNKGTDINFLTYTFKDSKGNNHTATPEEQAQAYDQFINNNKYLKNHKGDYVDRNSGLVPWYNRVDMRLLQDFFITTKNGTRHNLQFSWDVLNLPNLISKNWGVRKKYSINNPLIFKGVDANGVPTYNMNTYLNELATQPYDIDYTTSSTWGMQIGLRYSF